MAVLAGRDDDVRGRLGELAITILALSQNAADPPPFAHLADDAHDHDSVFGLYPPSGYLRLELPAGAVGQNGFELFARPERLGVRISVEFRGRIAPDDGDRLRSPGRQRVHALAEKLVPPVPEQLFGLRIDQRDPALLIGHDDRV